MRGMIAVVALTAALCIVSCNQAGSVAAPDALLAEQQEGAPPPDAKMLWPAPKDVGDRIAAASLYKMKVEGDEYHLHLHLEVFKGKVPVIVPGGIGVPEDRSFVSPVHTHTHSGVIHVEADEPRDFTLGQFFALWGVPLAGAEVTVDGQRIADPAAHVFGNYQLITVVLPA